MTGDRHELRNLTPHEIALTGQDGTEVVLPSIGLARVAMMSRVLGVQTVGTAVVPLVREVLGEVSGLPDPVEGVRFVVSRLVMAALPGRTDLACPTDLRRNDDGTVGAARALLVEHLQGAPAPAHLVVLAGIDPVPSLQAVATLGPERVTILTPPATQRVAANIGEAVRSLPWTPTVEIVVAADGTDRDAINEALQSVEPGWALDYTAGTRMMAAQARLAYDRRGDGRQRFATVVDGPIRCEDGTMLPLTTSPLNIDTLALLNGQRLVGGAPPLVTLNEMQEAQPAVRERIAPTAPPAERRVGSGAARLHDEAAVHTLLQAGGGAWLRALVAAAAAELADEVRVGTTLQLPASSAPSPEVDVVVRAGWDLAFLSCTTHTSADTVRRELAGAQHLASLLGVHSGVGLVCLGGASVCAHTRSEAAGLATDRPVALFGSADLAAWLQGDLTGLARLLHRRSD